MDTPIHGSRLILQQIALTIKPKSNPPNQTIHTKCYIVSLAVRLSADSYTHQSLCAQRRLKSFHKSLLNIACKSQARLSSPVWGLYVGSTQNSANLLLQPSAFLFAQAYSLATLISTSSTASLTHPHPIVVAQCICIQTCIGQATTHCNSFVMLLRLRPSPQTHHRFKPADLDINTATPSVLHWHQVTEFSHTQQTIKYTQTGPLQ